MEKEERLVITVVEMAALLRVSRPVAYKLTNMESFPVVQVGKRKLIPTEGLKRWLVEQSGCLPSTHL